jgi:U3 small nucleolar ribonucleoprotein protein IMP3
MIGTEVIKDPDFLVSRKMEDHLGWNDASKIKRKVKEFNNELDDYDLITN